MVNLSTNKIAEIGNKITEVLNSVRISNSELKIYVDNESFRKIDEDLYYRQNPDGDSFKESNDNIKIIFDNLTILIVKT